LGAHETQTSNFTDIGATVLRDWRYSTALRAGLAIYRDCSTECSWPALFGKSVLTLPTVLDGKHTDPVKNMTCCPLVRFMRSCNYTEQHWQ